MQSYAARYASFTSLHRSKSSSKTSSDLRWPHPDSYLATPGSLAAAGFYFNPSPTTPDAVSCFICDKGLADWDPEDDPAEIHAQKCPKCPWAMLKCILDVHDDGGFEFLSPSRLPTSRTMEKARLATFGPENKKWWPHDAKNKGPSAKMMAKAGFIYIPASSKDDTCTCVYCGIELGGWQPEDDPIEEHRRRQIKKGPCPFFTGSLDASTATKRARSRSKLPPTTPATSASSDQEYQPSGTQSSTRVTNSKKPSSNAKSKLPPKSSRRAAKSKAIEEEVVAEYHVALDEDQESLLKHRPKPRRASSRTRSQASSTRNTSMEETDSAPTFTKASSSRSTLVHEQSSEDFDSLIPRSSSNRRSTSRPNSSQKRADGADTQRSTRSRERPLSNDDKHSRVRSTSKSEPVNKCKGKKNKADEKAVKYQETSEEAPARSHRVRGKSKASADGGTPEQESELSRGRSKSKFKADGVAEDDQKFSGVEPQEIISTEAEEAEAKDEPEPLRSRSKGKSRAAIRNMDARPRRTFDADSAIDESDEPKGKLKSFAKAGVIHEEHRQAEPIRGRSKVSPSSKAKQADLARGKNPPTESDEYTVQFVQHPTSLSKPILVASHQVPPSNGVQHINTDPTPATWAQFKTFRSPEDEELAREEQALEEQARVLMRTDTTLNHISTPINRDTTQATEQQEEETILDGSFEDPPSVLTIHKGKGLVSMAPVQGATSISELAPPIITPSASTTSRVAPTAQVIHSPTVNFPQILSENLVKALTDAERAMTVEQWVRCEMDSQYERLRIDGRQKIDAFKARATEVARKIESL